MNQNNPRLILLLLAALTLLFLANACGSASGDDDDDNDNNVDDDDSSSNDDDDDTSSNGDDDDDTGSGGSIVLNEIDCHGRDWVELINTSSAALDLSGWYIADDLETEDHQYALPSGSVVAAGAYLVVKQEEDSETGFTFGLKCAGDTVYLLDADMNVIEQETIGDPPDGSTWGRLPDATGDWQETCPTQGSENQESAGTSTVLFNPLAVGTVAITLSDDAVTALTNDPYTYTEGQVQVTTTAGTSELLTVGVRLKSGESFQPITGKAAFKIKLNEYDSTTRLYGLKGFNLNNMINDASMMHETIAYAIMRGADVPAVRTGYAWVTVNGEDRGLYAVVENYDDVFADMNFENTLHVYEGMSDLLLTELDQIEVDEGDTADMQDLIALINAINDTEDAQWLSTVGELFDLSLFAKMWAAENYIGHSDGYSLAANNYFLHSDNDGYFTMMPWGTDDCFSDELTFPSGDSVLCQRCLNITACASAYDSALSALETAVSSLDIDSLVDDIDGVIASYVEDDPFKPYTVAEYEQAVTDLLSFLESRSATLKAQ